MTNLIYQFKILTKDKQMMFWTLIFPIILATFFSIAFSNLGTVNDFNTIDVAVVEQTENASFNQYIKQLTTSDDQLLNATYVDVDTAQQLLTDEDIAGYYLVDNEIQLVVNSNGINQSILKSVADKYYQVSDVIQSALQTNPTQDINQISSMIDFSTSNFVEAADNKDFDMSIIYFYSLIGMACIYAGFWGLKAARINEANLSYQGARINISPMPKSRSLITSLSLAYVIHFTNMMIYFVYLKYVLKLDFGSQTSSIILIMALGTFVGLMLGNFIANILHTSDNTKSSVFIIMTLAFSFLAGLNGPAIKYLVQEHLPFLMYINPVSLITDSLYSLYYDNIARFNQNLINMLVLGLILGVLSFVMMRRKKYDSI